MTNKTSRQASANQATKANQANQPVNQDPATKPATMTVVECTKAAAALLEQYKTTSAIKATSAALREQYGAKAWASIWATIKALRAKDIQDSAATIKAAALDYAAALECEYKRISKAPRWSHLMQFAAATWSTGAEFIAANYPNTIDGQPAALVAYVAPGANTIVTAYQPAARDARRAVADLVTALSALERATRKASTSGQDGAGIKATTTRQAGQVAGAYAAAADDAGRLVRGAAVDAATLARYQAIDVAGLETLTDYNKARQE